METGIAQMPAAPPAPPERTLLAFTTALSSGNLGAATDCLARDVCFLTPDATAVRGRDSVRAVLAQLILSRTEIAVEPSPVLVAAEVAIVRGRWTIRSNGAEGTRHQQLVSPTVALRRIEGAWKLAIVAPWAN